MGSRRVSPPIPHGSVHPDTRDTFKDLHPMVRTGHARSLTHAAGPHRTALLNPSTRSQPGLYSSGPEGPHGAPDGTRTHSLHRDKVASLPADCGSIGACCRTRTCGLGLIRTLHAYQPCSTNLASTVRLELTVSGFAGRCPFQLGHVEMVRSTGLEPALPAF